MPIKLPKKPVVAPEEPATETTMPTAQGLKGTAAKLAALVQEYGTYEYEGFTWLPFNRDVVAEKLGVNVKTIQRVITKPPFHRITRMIEVEGKTRKGVLLKLGTELCETDHVLILRAIWAKGLVYFNNMLSADLTSQVTYFKSLDAPEKRYARLLRRIEAAKDGAKDLDKLKSGKKISLEVRPFEMGLLREIVQTLGDDAPGVVSCLVTYVGWLAFTARLKADERMTRYLHWPQLALITGNLDIAVETYLDTLQEAGKISVSESVRLLTKIEALKPKDTS